MVPYTKNSKRMVIAVACLVTACDAAPTGPANVSARDTEPRQHVTSARPAAAGLSILACPFARAAEVSETIGPEGGVLTLGPYTLRIPEGALSSPVLVTMTRPAGARLILRVDIAGGDHIVLARPAELTIRYGICPRQDLERRAMRIVRLVQGSIDSSAEELVEYDEETGIITILTRRFSTFAVAY